MMGKPERPDLFNKHRVDDIDIYLFNNLDAIGNKLRIKLRKFLWTKSLKIEGLRVNLMEY